jgi:hypothetical protein
MRAYGGGPAHCARAPKVARVVERSLGFSRGDGPELRLFQSQSGPK